MATPPDFVSGAVLTAAQMNGIGLWLVKKQTIGSAVSSVTVTGAFSADFDNYKIMISGGAGSTAGPLSLQFGATTTDYYRSITGALWNGTIGISAQSNAASFGVAGWMQTGQIGFNMEIINPFLTKNTLIMGGVPQPNSGGASLLYQGYLENTISYTAFTLATGANTMTGGLIVVYGFRK